MDNRSHTKAESMQAVTVKCYHCEYQWIGFYLPLPIDKAVKALGALHCPKCDGGPSSIAVFDGTKDTRTDEQIHGEQS